MQYETKKQNKVHTDKHLHHHGKLDKVPLTGAQPRRTHIK